MRIITALTICIIGTYLANPVFSACHNNVKLIKVEEGVYVRPGQHKIGFKADNIANVGFVIGQQCVAARASSNYWPIRLW